MSDFAMEAADVRVSFGGRRALNGVSLVARRGEATVLLGPNGAGKSTFLRAALGLVPLASGVMRVAGLAVRRTGSPVTTSKTPCRIASLGGCKVLGPRRPHGLSQPSSKPGRRFATGTDGPCSCKGT